MPDAPVIRVARERLAAELDLNRRRLGYSKARAVLSQAARGDRPIVAGPFISEVGFETLYWVPLLRWYTEHYGIERERVTAVSRGGPVSWYDGIASNYVDLFDHISPSQLKEWRTARVEATRSEKQHGGDPLEGRLLELAGFDAGHWALQPSLMYGMFWAFFSRQMRRPIRRVLEHTRFEPFGRAETPWAKDVLSRLPESYVAVKPYFSGCFPPTPANRRFLAGMLERLTNRGDVVLLATGIDVDDHDDYVSWSDRIHRIDEHVQPHDNLEIQSAVIRKARALYSTYGGFAHLGPFLGTPTFAFYSDDDINPAHLEVMWRAVANLRRKTNAGFVLLYVDDLPLLDRLASGPLEGSRRP